MRVHVRVSICVCKRMHSATIVHVHDNMPVQTILKSHDSSGSKLGGSELASSRSPSGGIGGSSATSARGSCARAS